MQWEGWIPSYSSLRTLLLVLTQHSIWINLNTLKDIWTGSEVWLQKALDQILPGMFTCSVLVLHYFSLYRCETMLSNGLNLTGNLELKSCATNFTFLYVLFTFTQFSLTVEEKRFLTRVHCKIQQNLRWKTEYILVLKPFWISILSIRILW